MYKIIGADQKEYGPVTAEQLGQWIAAGRANGQTSTWSDAAAAWRPLSAFPEFADALNGRAGGGAPSGATAPPVSAEAWEAQLLAVQPTLQVGRCLSEGWESLRANFGLFFGASFVVWLLGTVCQFIPMVGGILYLLFHGVLYGGLYLIVLNRLRGRPATIGDVFAGFSLAFAQLLLAGCVSSLLSSLGMLLCLAPGIYLSVAWAFSLPLVIDKRLEFWSAMELSRKVVTRVWFQAFGLLVLAFLPVILVNLFAGVKISYTVFTTMRDLLSSGTPDPAHIRETIKGLSKGSMPLVLLMKGVLLLNLPFAVAVLMHAYEALFGSRRAPSA